MLYLIFIAIVVEGKIMKKKKKALHFYDNTTYLYIICTILLDYSVYGTGNLTTLMRRSSTQNKLILVLVERPRVWNNILTAISF